MNALELSHLSVFDTGPRGEDHGRCATWLGARLAELGFGVERHEQNHGPPLIIASRASTGLEGHVALYGHYDTEAAGPSGQVLVRRDGRIHGLGVADNKGPLACRLAAMATLDRTPAITWLIQGEEETGSTLAHRLFPDIMANLHPTVWLDETGYHDHEDGTLRLIASTVGPDGQPNPVDAALADLLERLGELARQHELPSRLEQRRLNKQLVKNGCPFNAYLPPGARYIALGINDSMSSIHTDDESVPLWTFPLHAAELALLFEWVHETESAS